MNHPKWYYQCYDDIFSRGPGYNQEIQLICDTIVCCDKRIKEIGSGTGGHARELLRRKVKHLTLTDVDQQACDICQKTFNNFSNVTVSCCDGFENQGASYDVVLCMYSLLQQSPSHQQLCERLQNVSNQLFEGGYFVSEYIDTHVSEVIYPDNIETTIIDDGTDHLAISLITTTRNIL